MKNLVRYSLAALAAAMLVSNAQATTYDLNLTLDPSQVSGPFAQPDGSLLFENYFAPLGDPRNELGSGIVVTQGDEIDATITVLGGGTYTIPASAYRTDFLQFLTGTFPTEGTDSDTGINNATMTFLLAGSPVVSDAGYSSTTSTELSSFATFQPVPTLDNSITFDQITDDFTIETLAGQDNANAGYTPETATITASSIQFSLVSQVPEPATWAMFLVGFGAIGFTLRNRKKAVAATA